MNDVNSVTSMGTMGTSSHAARRAVDLMCVLVPDKLSNASTEQRLTALLHKYGELDPHISASDIQDLRVAAGRLYEVFKAPDIESAASLLNNLLAGSATPPRLTAHDGIPWHIHVDSSDHAPWGEWLIVTSAFALAVLLAEKQRKPGGICASSVCGRPFLTSSKGGGRKYCSPRCATRERVAAFRAEG